ncbi:ubiquitin carboxy terminal hydrolase Uch1 [Schizosaccharomyces cryophilus OY26]|uniref:Ubiquitin carboxyl-terminal hydrolase n=1 Tax=Schizosaccharomyces cryophilus (strain OY26 / ATCC MYA-4695 / CBS 11777 / NBRC 106824 / NRRL Y48691) TaxID=653667 RepID=S9VWF0_SCHCR|nr:ubiquitin carboxy terminal hydrolase Uch1 [Schizosaccharomyces cryophilus OY26]EPY51963.1 ubiquitin carboxy terminal hydrolase Uch1 [Schizosaccharomyces cryophilus OY26]
MWKPLENNPEVLEPYLRKLGILNASVFDLFTLDEIPEYIPRPVAALLLVLPSPGKFDKSQKESKLLSADSKEVVWFPQLVSNACGTVALVHAIANGNLSKQKYNSKFTKDLLKNAREQTADERAKMLKDSEEVAKLHAEFAGEPDEEEEGDEEDETDLHYICFVKGTQEHDCHFYELDGRREGPIQHSEIENDVLDPKVFSVIKDYVQKTNSPYFSLVAITTTDDN